MPYRIGIGYDIHRLDESRKLFIGGIEIPYIKGLLGHSDGDVLIHSICDALLGAVCAGDIGELFPDTDQKYHNASSCQFLEKVACLIRGKGFQISNIDSVIIAQEPSIYPFKNQMRKVLAKILNIEENCINIKAKTNEGLGEIGKKEAIACYAVAILEEEK